MKFFYRVNKIRDIMIGCSELIAEVCEAFHARLWEICQQTMHEAVAYKQIVCALNHGCC